MNKATPRTPATPGNLPRHIRRRATPCKATTPRRGNRTLSLSPWTTRELNRRRRGGTWQALVIYFDDAELKPVVKVDWLASSVLALMPTTRTGRG